MDFTHSVLLMTSRIPPGKVSTYKEIARALGDGAKCRAVGNALNRNPTPVTVPCHRVVRTGGGVGGYAFGTREKARLLRNEGIPIKKNKVVDLHKRLFTAESMLSRQGP